MKRADFLKRLGVLTTVGICIPSVFNNIETLNEPMAVERDPVRQSSVYTHVNITDGNGMYINGEWDRRLTSEEIMKIYNNGLPLTYKEIIDGRLLPNKTVSFWMEHEKS